MSFLRNMDLFMQIFWYFSKGKVKYKPYVRRIRDRKKGAPIGDDIEKVFYNSTKKASAQKQPKPDLFFETG